MGDTFSRLLCFVAGYLYPAYKTYKAIEAGNQDDYMKWLTYWIVHTTFTSLEFVLDIFLPLIVPFYHQIKLLLYLWLVSPQSNGAELIYQGIIQPYLMKNEKQIEQQVSVIRDHFSGIGPQLMGKLQESSLNIVTNTVSRMNQLKSEAENRDAIKWIDGRQRR